MIIYTSYYPKVLRPGINNIIDWATIGSASNTLGTSIAWTVTQPIGFGGTIIRWGNNGSLYGGWGTQGKVNTNAAGHLQYVFNGDSDTFGQVSAFNDGTISVTQFTTFADVKYTALQKACIEILKQTGKVGRPYKLDVIKNGQLEFTIRSIQWGTLNTYAENEPNYQTVDRQFANTADAYY